VTQSLGYVSHLMISC